MWICFSLPELFIQYNLSVGALGTVIVYICEGGELYFFVKLLFFWFMDGGLAYLPSIKKIYSTRRGFLIDTDAGLGQ